MTQPQLTAGAAQMTAILADSSHAQIQNSSHQHSPAACINSTTTIS
jgi:hypothetical protein